MNFNNELKEYPFLTAATEISEEMGDKVYIIGGFVRDLILNRNRDEIDFLVLGNGTGFAEKYAAKLGIKNVSVFRNYGTAHFRYNDFDLEFVGARKESY